MNPQFYKNMALWVVILVMLLLLVTMFQQGDVPSNEIDYSDFLARVENGEIDRVTIEDQHLDGAMRDGTETNAANSGSAEGRVAGDRRRRSYSRP